MKLKNLWIITMIVSSLFLLGTFSVEAADVTISDGMEDVNSLDYNTGVTNLVTSHPDIDVDNLDLIQATYTQQGTQVTVSLQVKGNIENRGNITDLNDPSTLDFNTVEYGFQIFTSEQDYSVGYSNETAQLVISSNEQINLPSSNFSVVGDTLSIWFSLLSAEEIYENLSATSTFIKADFFSTEPEVVFLSDIAPNPPLEIFEAYASNIGSIGESIQFNGSVESLTGQPPYAYHWDFGDQSSPSTQQNPTHTYTKAGVYTYIFTVNDNGDATASQSGTITISAEGGGTNNSLSNQMILFLAILLIVIVIGVVVIVWIIRR